MCKCMFLLLPNHFAAFLYSLFQNSAPPVICINFAPYAAFFEVLLQFNGTSLLSVASGNQGRSRRKKRGREGGCGSCSQAL